MYVREKPCDFARTASAASRAAAACSCLGPGARLPRGRQLAWGKTGLFARRFATYRVALSLHVAALARRRPQRPGCVAAALPARGNQRSQPRRGDGNGLARGAQGPAHDARQSPPGADSVLGGGETAAEQLETGLQRLQYTDQLPCDEVEALVCGIARNTPHLHRTRWKTLIAFVTRQNHHH